MILSGLVGDPICKKYPSIAQETNLISIKKIIDFFINFNFKFSYLDRKIENMVTYSDFNHLKKTENTIGFDEAVANNSFFNKGTKDQWMDKLSNEQILRIEKTYYYLLKELNYKIKLYKKA